MVHDHHPADPDRQIHRRDLREVELRTGRQDDRVVAIHPDTASGTLGARVNPCAAGSLWDLAGPPTSKRCLILRIGHQGVRLSRVS